MSLQGWAVGSGAPGKSPGPAAHVTVIADLAEAAARSEAARADFLAAAKRAGHRVNDEDLAAWWPLAVEVAA